jgi:hypothetical protein
MDREQNQGTETSTQETEMAATMHTITVLDQSGDYTIAWDPSKDDEVSMAHEQFDQLRAKGYMLFTLTEAREFDPLGGRFEVRMVGSPVVALATSPTKKARGPRGLGKAKGEMIGSFVPEAALTVAVPAMRGG